jgi:hypothetical protein
MVWRPIGNKVVEARMQMVWRRGNQSPVLKAFQRVVRAELGMGDDPRPPQELNGRPGRNATSPVNGRRTKRTRRQVGQAFLKMRIGDCMKAILVMD